MLKKKYILVVISFLSLLTSLCMISETYAKYVTAATNTTSSSIARWKILVNNDDITLGATSSNLITPVFPGSDDIAADVIAPNSEGYFDLILDCSDIDVSFRYTITINPNPNSPVTELVATKYMIDGCEEIEFDGDAEITGTFTYSDTEKTSNIRVFVKWDDSLNLMTNAEDTDTTVGEQKGMLDVTINVIQI